MSEETTGREGGRFTKGHKLGGRPKGSRNAAPVVAALEGTGQTLDDLRRTLMASTISALTAPEASERTAARRLLAQLVFPHRRSLDVPDLFSRCRTPEDMLAAVTGGVAVGALAPDEGADLAKLVQALADSGDWERLRELHSAALAAGDQGRALPVGAEPQP